MPTLREPTADDALALSTITVRSWQAAYRGIVPDDHLDAMADDDREAQFAEVLARPPRDGIHRLVSCDDEGRPVAQANAGPAIEPDGDATGQLYLLYALPEVWGRGHGSALLREVHARLAADGHAAAQLWVAERNERTIAIYEHHGWRLDGATKRDKVGGVQIEQARMTLDLRSRVVRTEGGG